jgi:hypothetical protein
LGLIPTALVLFTTSAQPAAAPPSDFRSRSVNWTAATTVPTARRGGRVPIVLAGSPAESWHIYGFGQQPRGPISLAVALDPSPLATADGRPTASPPIKVFEPAFGLETPYYLRNFSVTIPIRLKADAPIGRQLIPVSIRFQACSGGTCEPPKTIHLSAPVQVVG